MIGGVLGAPRTIASWGENMLIIRSLYPAYSSWVELTVAERRYEGGLAFLNGATVKRWETNLVEHVNDDEADSLYADHALLVSLMD